MLLSFERFRDLLLVTQAVEGAQQGSESGIERTSWFCFFDNKKSLDALINFEGFSDISRLRCNILHRNKWQKLLKPSILSPSGYWVS
jgi:hypothetical protein